MTGRLAQLTVENYKRGKRLTAPLVGFPGLNLIPGASIKLAQQNYGIHYEVIKALTQRLQPDIVFPLMDLSVEANALGRVTVFPKNDSATVVRDEFDLSELETWRRINVGLDTRLTGYVELQRLMSIGMPPTVIRGAYVAGPYSLSALILGADTAALTAAMEPEKLEQICEFATDTILTYIRQLISAGVQCVCVLEPTAGALGPLYFEQCSVRHVRRISSFCRACDVACVYHICGDTRKIIDQMLEADVDALSLDSPEAGVNLSTIANRIPSDIVLIGNINPTGTILRGSPDEVACEVETLLTEMDPYPNFILSTGCDLPQTTPMENIEAFMQAGRTKREHT